MKKLTHEDYLQKLKDKDIKVIPIEKYINARTKILHKCTCGNEWLSSAKMVLDGYKCGCNKNIGHKKYLEQLHKKDIKVIPLEKYIDMKTKILHKCTCGNEWNIKPSKVIEGIKCGCNRIPTNKLTHEEYLLKIKDKKIEIKPLEKYIDMKTKILHKCTCGNEWVVAPSSILKGYKCGCMKGSNLHDINTYRNRKTILYYLKVNSYWKIGIAIHEKFDDPIKTIMDYRQYGKKLYKDYNIEILQYRIYNDGAEAFNIEKNIKEKYHKYKNYLTSENMNNFGGYRELFTRDILSDYLI